MNLVDPEKLAALGLVCETDWIGYIQWVWKPAGQRVRRNVLSYNGKICGIGLSDGRWSVAILSREDVGSFDTFEECWVFYNLTR